MSRITWGDTGTRFYEQGTDRGVLFLAGIAGVPWNGLKSVTESPSGGEATPYYFDGVKYQNVLSSEEFEATIKAFSSPSEFGECDGESSLANGLFVSQQPRKPFGLSYRTQIGNDLEALQHGYKIHLVYNALASPTQKDNATIGGAATPTDFSWPISTTPVEITGRKASAHLIIDSRTTDSLVLLDLENLLYGTDETSSSLPTVEEVITLFTT